MILGLGEGIIDDTCLANIILKEKFRGPFPHPLRQNLAIAAAGDGMVMLEDCISC